MKAAITAQELFDQLKERLDLRWLAGVGADVAVVPVGANDFGHPDPDVLLALQVAGAEVRRTDIDGDVVIPLR